jgi:CheY-like chemotaxis protein
MHAYFEMEVTGSIVIVDDDDDDHYILRRVCEKIGVTAPIIFFTDARNALDYLRSSDERPFLILSDVNMPVVNGLELKRQIDADPELCKRAIPFIFFSTSAMAQVVREAFDMSVHGFFIKGQNLDDLEDTLRVIFEYWNRCERPKQT